MTVDFALRLASAAAQVLIPGGGKVLIGKDTRVSGYMFESALEAGFVASGVDVLLTGPLPTPAIAYLTSKTGSDFGIVISASHNPYYDNGIKFFDASGQKLSDDLEKAIEAKIEERPMTRDSSSLGRATTLAAARDDYMDFCVSTLPAEMARWPQNRGRRITWRRVQGRAAPDGRARGRRRSGRLLAERPQHQRWLRFDPARFAKAHGNRRARARRHRARRRR